MWALAAVFHIVHSFGRQEDSFLSWSIEILVASIFATGFGWHLNRLVTLTKMERRGKFTFNQKFREVQL